MVPNAPRKHFTIHFAIYSHRIPKREEKKDSLIFSFTSFFTRFSCLESEKLGEEEGGYWGCFSLSQVLFEGCRSEMSLI